MNIEGYRGIFVKLEMVEISKQLYNQRELSEYNKMAVPQNKEELLNAISTNYQKLKKELSTIPCEQTTLKELDGHSKGTMMSINNLVAYLVGWGELVLKWNRQIDANLHVDFPETGFKWNELGQLAQKFYEDYKEDDFDMLFSDAENKFPYFNGVLNFNGTIMVQFKENYRKIKQSILIKRT